MDYDKIEIVRSSRKTKAIEVKKDGRVLVRVPYRSSEASIKEFIDAHRSWINKHVAKVENAIASAPVDKLSADEIRELADKALEVIPEKVAHYAPMVGVTYGRITIRNQRTRWGSCSGKGNLNFNCLLMLAPSEVVDSVVVHELCHRLEMNHSKAFYANVLRVFPDYYKWDKWLKENGNAIMNRMP